MLWALQPSWAASPAHLDWDSDPVGQFQPALPKLEPRPTPPPVFITSIDIPAEDEQRIGRRIWKNECSGTVAGLTSWNQGEAFASLGIGHFIWYPAGSQGPFQEIFPQLLEFLADNGVALPDWLCGRPACPWPDRETFLKDADSPRMKQLRDLLSTTVALQTRFIVNRMEASLPKILDTLPPAEQEPVRRQFYRVATESLGVYGLVDYINFKGEGISPSERYKDEGWGLLQVLQGMSGTAQGQAALDEYSLSADRVITRRVANAPPERHEERWLPGWRARVRTYRTGPL
jgi:hypothetical protein